MKQSNILLYLGAWLCQLTGAVPAAEISASEAHIDARHDSIAIGNAELESRQATDCRRGLSCSYDYIESQPFSWRQSYLRTIGNDHLSRYSSGNKCRSIEGQIAVLIELRLAPKSWTSCQNAGLIEAVQNAAANVLGVHSRDGGNPGTRQWSNYFRKVRAGNYPKDQQDSDWATCEETSSEYGRQIGERRRYRPTPPERSCYKSSQTYRYLLRNKAQSSSILRGVLGLELGVGGLLNGVVNLVAQVNLFVGLVCNYESTRSGYRFYKTGAREIGPEDYDKSNADTVKELGPELYEDFQEP